MLGIPRNPQEWQQPKPLPKFSRCFRRLRPKSLGKKENGNSGCKIPGICRPFLSGVVLWVLEEGNLFILEFLGISGVGLKGWNSMKNEASASLPPDGLGIRAASERFGNSSSLARAGNPGFKAAGKTWEFLLALAGGNREWNFPYSHFFERFPEIFPPLHPRGNPRILQGWNSQLPESCSCSTLKFGMKGWNVRDLELAWKIQGDKTDPKITGKGLSGQRGVFQRKTWRIIPVCPLLLIDS